MSGLLWAQWCAISLHFCQRLCVCVACRQAVWVLIHQSKTDGIIRRLSLYSAFHSIFLYPYAYVFVWMKLGSFCSIYYLFESFYWIIEANSGTLWMDYLFFGGLNFVVLVHKWWFTWVHFLGNFIGQGRLVFTNNILNSHSFNLWGWFIAFSSDTDTLFVVIGLRWRDDIIDHYYCPMNLERLFYTYIDLWKSPSASALKCRFLNYSKWQVVILAFISILRFSGVQWSESKSNVDFSNSSIIPIMSRLFTRFHSSVQSSVSSAPSF